MLSRQYPHSDVIYKALPFFYVSAGLLAMLLIPGWMAVLSGLIMLSAGGAIWTMRYSYRRSSARNNAPAPTGLSPGKPLEISWRDSFECGHAVIDEQHKRLFVISNELVNALVSCESKVEIDRRLLELIDQITNHFITEEVLMAESKHPLLAEHQEHHVALLAKTKSLREGYLKNEVVAGELLNFIAYELMVSHILKDDSKWLTPRSL